MTEKTTLVQTGNRTTEVTFTGHAAPAFNVFEALAKRIVNVPKDEVDAERKKGDLPATA